MRLLVIVGFVLFLLSVTIPFTSLASTHPCASPTPPSVTGTPVQPSTDARKLFINEVLLNPHATWNCSEMNGTSTPINDAWVEIYNSQDVAYDLYGVRAALDSGAGTNPFYFPKGSAIAAHSFLVIFPRTDANFSQSETSTLRLLISGTPVDSITIPTLPIDTSYARSPDGSDTWQILTTPTIGASNPLLQMSPTSTSAISVVHTPSPTSSRRTATKTPTPHTSSPRKRSSGSTDTQDTGGTDTTSTDSASTAQVDGNQPTWNKMSIAASLATPTATTTETSSDEQISSPSNDNSNNQAIRKLELTLVIIALAGCLLWCGKLFLPLAFRKQNR